MSFNCPLKAGSETYKEGSMESQIFGPRCFTDLLALTVEAICQMYPPRVAARVAWEWVWFTGVNNWSKLTGILSQCNLCMNLPISRMYISSILSKFSFLYNGETLDLQETYKRSIKSVLGFVAVAWDPSNKRYVMSASRFSWVVVVSWIMAKAYNS